MWEELFFVQKYSCYCQKLKLLIFKIIKLMFLPIKSTFMLQTCINFTFLESTHEDNSKDTNIDVFQLPRGDPYTLKNLNCSTGVPKSQIFAKFFSHNILKYGRAKLMTIKELIWRNFSKWDSLILVNGIC